MNFLSVSCSISSFSVLIISIKDSFTTPLEEHQQNILASFNIFKFKIEITSLLIQQVKRLLGSFNSKSRFNDWWSFLIIDYECKALNFSTAYTTAKPYFSATE
ncbi:transposable element [Pseudoloma neurophilia]|uniref:Transposable element n=1 Tax=Pseudoloma neurophilia TaxID=146866 RepID=A0A0R0LUV1_9MICR|nr:transposable element [Pseudoloma neurophilia]